MQFLKLLTAVSGISMISGGNAANISEIIPIAGQYAANNFTAMAQYAPQITAGVVGGLTGFGWFAYNI